MRTYVEAQEFATGRKRKLANNTYFVETDGGGYGVRLHNTVIVRWEPDGRTVLDTGGWKTVTTKARMNDYMPSGWVLGQERGVWFLWASGQGRDGAVVYADGMYWLAGKWHGAGKDPKAELKLRAAVRKYAKTFADKLDAGKIPAPNGGDCWLCGLFPEKTPDADHIKSHLTEKYYVPTLALKAVEKYASTAAHDYVVACMRPELPNAESVKRCWGDIGREQTERAIRKHCYRGLGLA